MAVLAPRLEASPPSFADVVASELTKLRTTRSTYVEIVLSIVIALGMTALIALAVGSTFDELSVEDQLSFESEFVALFGSAFGGIVLMILGVTVVSSEYTSGMIRLTFTTTPRRGRLLAAKFTAITLLTLAVGFVVMFAAHAIGQAILGSYDAPTSSLGEGDTLRAMIAASVLTPIYPVFGAAIAAVVRSTAPAIAGVLTLFFAPSIFGPLFPSSWQENVLRWLPGNAADHLIWTDSGSDGNLYLSEPAAFLVLCAWLAGFIGVAYVSTIRRDV